MTAVEDLSTAEARIKRLRELATLGANHFPHHRLKKDCEQHGDLQEE